MKGIITHSMARRENKNILFRLQRGLAVLLCGLCASVCLMSCKNDKKNAGPFPEGFDKMGDAGRVGWMLRNAPVDSVARFIIRASLGQVPGARIDTLAIATNYAYERLKGDDLETFSMEYGNMVESLPLADKMLIYKLGGSEDPQGLGYRLGLEYVAAIRNDHKTVADIEKELTAFQKACANDSDTYRRFIIGFKTVLKVDSGKDLPKDIYNRFINY